MRTFVRKFIYIFLSALIFLIGFMLGTPYLLSIMDLDHELKSYIIQKLSKDGETRLNVDNIDIGFGKISLKNIEYRNENAKTEISISGIQFGYDFIKLISNIQAPHKAIDQISLLEPKLVFRQMEQQNLFSNGSHDTSEYNLLEVLNQFENINRINFKDGGIFWKRTKDESIVLANNLSGWIDSQDFSSISLNADGDIFYGSNANFEMFSKVNFINESFFIQLDLKNYDLKNAPIVKFNDKINISKGIIDSKVDIKSDHFSLDSIIINGYLSLKKTDFTIYNTEFKDLEIHAQVNNNRLLLNDGHGKIGDSEFTFAAEITDIFNPVVVGDIRSDRMEIKSFTDHINLDGFENQFASLKGDFSITPSAIAANASLYAPHISFNEQDINRLKLNLSLDKGVIRCNKYSFETSSFEIQGVSSLNLEDGMFHATSQSRRKFSDHFFFDNLSDAEEIVSLKLTGNVSSRKSSGYWNYLLTNPKDTLLTVTGDIDLEDDIFNFSNNRTSDNDFLVTLQIENIFKNPTINFGYFENFPFYVFTSREWVNDFIRRYDIEGILVGTVSDLNAQISLTDTHFPERQLAFTTSLHDILEIEKKFSGSVKFNKLESEYQFTLDEDQLTGTIKSNHSLNGIFDIDLSRENQINASINFEKFELNKLLTDTTLSGFGEINGKILIAGNLDNPQLRADLTGDRFIINDMGYYRFDVSLKSDSSNFNVDTLIVALNNRPILNGKVAIDYQAGIIDARVHGNNIDTGYLMKTALNTEEILSGTGQYYLKASGPIKSPYIAGSLNLKNGILEKIPFDEIKIAFEDSLSVDSAFFNYKNHNININEFLAVKGGQYHLEGTGNLPLFDNGSIDLDIQFDGDILWLIPKWDSFFIDGASYTTIKLKVSGTPSRPYLTKGYAKIERGELWLKDVAKHVENIHGEIFINESSNFISLSNITGEVDGRKLVINNKLNVVTSDGKKIEPWYFKDINLNFGILSIETSPEGVELTIPSLMLEGESGSIVLTGKTDNEFFYFGGPVREPYAWGKVILSDSRITYPFPPGDGGEPSNAVKFLRNINWDIEVKPGRDLEYSRKIPGFLGEVNTDVNIDPASEGLILKGIIDEDTFLPEGKLISSRGNIDYLDLNFRVENFGFVFNRDAEPEIYGRARTTVRDSIGAAPKTIYLELYAIDRATGLESKRARWEDFRFRLVSADPTIGESQEQVLAYLGYSVDNIQDKAKKVGGAMTDNYLIRPLLRPLERSIEKYLGFDFVRFNARIAENLFSAGQSSQSKFYNQYDTGSSLPYALLIQSSEFTIGKYLTQDLYLTYTGQVVATAADQENNFNLNHSVELEYRFLKNLLFEFEYDRETLQFYKIYNSRSYQEDFKVRFRYSFSF